MRKGYVHILSNQYKPGIIKIGRTDKSPNERLRNLSKPSGNPVLFKIENAVFLVDIVGLEKMLHAEQAILRINSRRDFFKIDVENAKTILRNRHGEQLKSITKFEDLSECDKQNANHLALINNIKNKQQSF